ncbi:hypothetical protein [Paraburkholderia atlantica]|uniref:hypothetical protein n=1 Tax=Paraburkholderia atlantica TaxID=2654982 RepID=UPI00160A6C6C|nr:hypothetical protein [Paraburkholderia atlantica]MBB5507391.1 hypothetical protein [Paraburkholderia atlantica]
MPRAAQTHAQSVAARETVGQRLLKISNSRTLFDEGEPRTDAAIALHRAGVDVAAAAIRQRVAREFARRLTVSASSTRAIAAVSSIIGR